MRIKDHTIDVLRHGDYTEMILMDGTFFTPARLYEKGIMACNVCGTLMPIEKKYCPQCKEWVICIHEDYLARKEAITTQGELPIPYRDENLTSFIERFMRHDYTSYKYPNGLVRFNKAKRVYSNHRHKHN